MDDDRPKDEQVVLACIILLLLIAIVELLPALLGVTP